MILRVEYRIWEKKGWEGQLSNRETRVNDQN